MKRIVLGVVAVAVLVFATGLLFAPDAWAHGGQFRGPGDSVPPGLREPSDPTPPPPPPPSGPPPTPTPITPTPTPVQPTQPTTPGQGPPTPTTGPDTTGPQRRATPPSFEDWTFWYHNNNEDIENLKWNLYNKLSSENPLFVSTRDTSGARGAEMRWTQKKVKETVIPTFRWAMDPDNSEHQDTESAAYIALAKVTQDPADIDEIMKGLATGKDKRDQIVQESAALGLGLLRRAAKDDQFSARELDRAREFLFNVFTNGDFQDRVRGFAAIAIGLLGDQPTGSGEYANDVDAAAKATTTRLFDLLKVKYSNQDLYVALFLGIGLQPATSVTKQQREDLAECALKGRLYKESAADLTRSYAALALGRIGSAGDIRVLENIMNARRNVKDSTKRSAAIGLGLLGRLVSGPDRVEVANVLLRGIDRTKDNSTKNFGIISLAYLLIEDIKSKSTDVIGNSTAEDYLLQTATKGSYLHKGFGAIALGLVVREIDDDLEVESYQKFREDAIKVLRGSVESKRMDKKTRAAFCTSVGIARDTSSREALRKILDDSNGDQMLRGYAALGLGLIGRSNPEIAKSIADAMGERSSDELRRQTATALGLLGNPKIAGTGKDAVELLVEELKEARSQSHKGQVVLALARVGDHRAVDLLVRLVRNKGEQDLTRALACAGLGLIGDLELIPSLARGSKNINYRASTDIVNEFLSIL